MLTANSEQDFLKLTLIAQFKARKVSTQDIHTKLTKFIIENTHKNDD